MLLILTLFISLSTLIKCRLHQLKHLHISTHWYILQQTLTLLSIWKQLDQTLKNHKSIEVLTPLELYPTCPLAHITYTPNAFDDVYTLSTSSAQNILEQIETMVYSSPLYVCSFNCYHRFCLTSHVFNLGQWSLIALICMDDNCRR